VDKLRRSNLKSSRTI